VKKAEGIHLPIGTQALILSKMYYGALTKSLEKLDIERYFSVLYFLHNNKNCCQQVVCDNLKIDKTAMVKVLDYLGKAGLIERQVNPDDRREHFISLSKKGEKQTKEIVRSFKMIDEKAFSGINETERKAFIRVMHKLSENLERLPSDDLFFNYKKTKK
jgi:MarR family transcriptional regulator, transcriptional regulator for hemolysin